MKRRKERVSERLKLIKRWKTKEDIKAWVRANLTDIEYVNLAEVLLAELLGQPEENK
jgi:hypothetical protein